MDLISIFILKYYIRRFNQTEVTVFILLIMENNWEHFSSLMNTDATLVLHYIKRITKFFRIFS